MSRPLPAPMAPPLLVPIPRAQNPWTSSSPVTMKSLGWLPASPASPGSPVDYQALPSPPEATFSIYDPQFGERVCMRYMVSLRLQKIRMDRYGVEIAAEYRHGFTPQSARDAWQAALKTQGAMEDLFPPCISSDDEAGQASDHDSLKRKREDCDADSWSSRKHKRNADGDLNALDPGPGLGTGRPGSPEFGLDLSLHSFPTDAYLTFFPEPLSRGRSLRATPTGEKQKLDHPPARLSWKRCDEATTPLS